MSFQLALGALILGAGLCALPSVLSRLRLSRAKHPSLQGHPAMARRLARSLPYYAYEPAHLFACDGAPAEVSRQRQADFHRLAAQLSDAAPRSRELAKNLVGRVADAEFVNTHRVPFQFQSYVQHYLPGPSVIDGSSGVYVRDPDGNWFLDLTGSYGMNVFGGAVYKACLERGFERARGVGPTLGGYHPVVADNAERLQRLSGLDSVSFHMSGTEAVMQAVRMARYHTGRRHVVRFAGAYHGWWDGVQPGVGNRRRNTDIYTLRAMHVATLEVLRTRRDIAAVLVNPIQAMHPNQSAPGDAGLVGGRHCVEVDAHGYGQWLRELRRICTARGIVLIFDEVFSGFRLARGGAQEYFGIAADLATYGKSLGGGLPVGVLCGHWWCMKRSRDERPADVCFARGTFNGHPYVMMCMNELLRTLESAELLAGYADLHAVWDARTASLNRALEARGMPVRLTNFGSVLSVGYTRPSRYNWMFQFYLRAQGLAVNWTGTGRLIMSHDTTGGDFEALSERFIRAAQAMHGAGWWWHHPDQSERTIRRQIIREMFRALAGHQQTQRPQLAHALRSGAPARDGV